jgi:beta-lactam-binding protein with PASTA domain
VSGQIPAPGQTIPGNSEVLLYMDEMPSRRMVAVPDFSGMHRQQAAQTAGELGLYLLVSGNTDLAPQITVTTQSITKDTQVPVGTTITLEFTDTAARD